MNLGVQIREGVRGRERDVILLAILKLKVRDVAEDDDKKNLFFLPCSYVIDFLKPGKQYNIVL